METEREYFSQYWTSIYHEDKEFYNIIAAIVSRSQAITLPAVPLDSLGNLANKFEYITPDVLILSTRFKETHIEQFFARGFQRVIVCDYSFININIQKAETKPIQNLIYTLPENITDHVKLHQNTYSLFDDYITVLNKGDNVAAVAHKLKCLKRGITIDGTSYEQKIKDIADKIRYTCIIQSMIERGQVYFDISESLATRHMDEAQIIKVTIGSTEHDVALINSCDVSIDALRNLAPIYQRLSKCQVHIYLSFCFVRATWVLSAHSNGASAVLALNAICDSVDSESTINVAVGYLQDISKYIVPQSPKEPANNYLNMINNIDKLTEKLNLKPQFNSADGCENSNILNNDTNSSANNDIVVDNEAEDNISI